MRWAGHVARMGRGEVCTGFLVGKPEGMRPLGRSMHRWEENINIGLQEAGRGDKGWIHLAFNRGR